MAQTRRRSRLRRSTCGRDHGLKPVSGVAGVDDVDRALRECGLTLERQRRVWNPRRGQALPVSQQQWQHDQSGPVECSEGAEGLERARTADEVTSRPWLAARSRSSSLAGPLSLTTSGSAPTAPLYGHVACRSQSDCRVPRNSWRRHVDDPPQRFCPNGRFAWHEVERRTRGPGRFAQRRLWRRRESNQRKVPIGRVEARFVRKSSAAPC